MFFSQRDGKMGRVLEREKKAKKRGGWGGGEGVGAGKRGGRTFFGPPNHSSRTTTPRQHTPLFSSRVHMICVCNMIFRGSLMILPQVHLRNT